MQGLMMDVPLTLKLFMLRAAQYFPNKEIVTRRQQDYHRYDYRTWYQRVQRLAGGLRSLNIQKGDRVGTLAWNTHRHLELYFAVPCMGAVLHTLNLRLPDDELVYIINHAGDRVIFVDDSLLPLLVRIRERLQTVEHVIWMSDQPNSETPPETLNYEALLSAEVPVFDWPEIEETAALAMCYTSGTTGLPKGVVYSHRAIVLHTFAAALKDALEIGEADVVMPVVPMFHALTWGIPFVATMLGCKQVFPGRYLQPESIAQILEDEQVTISGGVPSIWLPLQEILSNGEYDLSHLRTMPVGGSAAPRSLIEAYERMGIQIIHAWGMTETSPLGTISRIKSDLARLSEEEQLCIRSKQGLPVPGIELRGIDEQGLEIPWDGKTMGELQVRGPWVIQAYFQDERNDESFTEDGWFRTGDVITIDGEGYIQIVDRTKDLVKSGGEWISSLDLENAIMSHPEVVEAAVIAIPHVRWQERPLAVVVVKGSPPHREEIFAILRERFAKWQLPDDIVYVDEIPKTSVGKFDKKMLRAQFAKHRVDA
ncbi:MAG: long-chain fatty acid--CoA ligase [Anaerolineaceae bacterium]|nr:long-chain fatty acid--CoA ligase [Anaerolineaceae bacterium]